ncbi:MAG: HIT family protein [Gemmataceae bacterium]
MAFDDCPLCRKIAVPPAEEVVWEFPHSIVFLGPWQHYQGYCVVVSRTHASEMHHLPEAVRHAFFEEMCVVSKAIETAFAPRKINVESLGNQVQHPHWHLFPRSAADPETLKTVWLALDRAEKDESEKRRLQNSQLPRQEIIARLRAARRG